MSSSASNKPPPVPPRRSPDSDPNRTTPPTQQVDRKKESGKRRRNHLSCAECRRLKVTEILIPSDTSDSVHVRIFLYQLRCDRVFPCESCRKRGCASICPEGALTTKGTRFVLANTEELHVKIVDMSERIRQLENALAAAHSPDPHPLLREDLLLVKVPIEFRNEADISPQASPPETHVEEKESFPTLLNAFGTLKIGADGHSRFFGQTARTEHFLKDDSDSAVPDLPKTQQLLPLEVLRISQAFPFGSQFQDTQITRRILDFLPPISDAWPLIDTYYANAAFIYEPCPRRHFEDNILTHVYEHAQDPEGISSHRLALVFAVLAHGALMDLNREPYSSFSGQLHQLARASLAMSPFLEEPSLIAIQALFLIGFYLVLVNKKEAANAGWAIQALNCKLNYFRQLAEMLGLHRDLEYWDAEDKESQGEARRKVFWEIVTLDGWMSLGLGRPAAIHFSQIDCKPPAATQHAMDPSHPRIHDWHTWKHGLAHFVSRVLQMALVAKTPPYSEILELDRSIHEFVMPPDVEALANGLSVQPPRPEETPGLTMQRGLLLQARSTVVLLLHRGFFAQALSEETDPMQSKFAPSVLATYRSACSVILALHSVYSQHPALSCRFGLLWSNVFSASISLCLMVTRATRSSYAPFALGQLDLASELFSKAAPECSPASKALPIVTRLRDKAHAAYAPYRHGQHPSSLASRKALDNDDEELKILGGKTNIVSAQLQTPSPPPAIGLGTSQSYSEHFDGSRGVPLQMPPTHHLDSVHPSLVEYLAQTRWMPGTPSEQLSEQSDGHASVPLESSRQPSLHPQHGRPYPQQQHDYTATPVQSDDYHVYAAYSSDSSALAPSSLAGALRGSNPSHHAYVDHPGTSLGSGPGLPELHRPQQNQYATWQTYMEQLGLPG